MKMYIISIFIFCYGSGLNGISGIVDIICLIDFKILVCFFI